MTDPGSTLVRSKSCCQEMVRSIQRVNRKVHFIQIVHSGIAHKLQASAGRWPSTQCKSHKTNQ